MAPDEVDPEAARAAARTVPRWEDQDFVGQVSPPTITEYGSPDDGGPLIGIVDLGLKSNIVRAMGHRGARVRVFPHTAGSRDVLSPDIDGIILSPGPGDPARLASQVALAAAVIDDGRPLLGICLGHQIVGRAAGADTRRLRFGHHGANHPVQDVDLGLVQVTAQNHEVQVVGDSLPSASGFHVSQINLNDRSVEGLRHEEKPIETVQYHPEGAPGPLDALAVFDRFLGACLVRAAARPASGR
jgi:carbamoyl-phosphate synthase small subunit